MQELLGPQARQRIAQIKRRPRWAFLVKRFAVAVEPEGLKFDPFDKLRASSPGQSEAPLWVQMLLYTQSPEWSQLAIGQTVATLQGATLNLKPLKTPLTHS